MAHRERIDWHDHAEHQLVYPSSGVLHVRTDRGAWVVPPRRAVWLPAGVPHSHRAHGRTQMLTLAFSADINPLNAIEPTVLAVGQLLREVIIALAEDGTLGPDDRADLYRIALRRLTPTPALHHHLPAMTFPQWRGQLRLQHAMLQLATGSTVTGAAAASGYTNTSAFIAAFRDAFGVTPAAYRNSSGVLSDEGMRPARQARPPVIGRTRKASRYCWPAADTVGSHDAGTSKRGTRPAE